MYTNLDIVGYKGVIILNRSLLDITHIYMICRRYIKENINNKLLRSLRLTLSTLPTYTHEISLL